MTDTLERVTARAVLSGIEPQLFVADVRGSCDFYTGKMGFGVAFLYGNPPFYAQVFRDNARLNLRLVSEPVFAGDVRRREGLLSASVTLGSAAETRQLFEEYEAAGVLFHDALKREPWGALTFAVSDPDGNLILFAGPAED